MSNKYTPTIGLEIHVQLKTKSKMFCGCDNNAEEKEPNTVVCPVCMGLPGVLPVPNKQALEWAVKLGKFLDGEILEDTKFDRKHYFYPDLPKGYQISQYDEPIVKGGKINIDGKEIHLERIHIEEDAGKLIHMKDKNYSLVDFNRAGTPLLEIVTKPEINSPEEAKKFMQRLRLIVRYLGISDGDMEKGHLRCDANISITAVTGDKCQVARNNNDQTPITKHQSPNSAEASLGRPITSLGTPVEIKNLNSFLMVERALKYEIDRQSKLIDVEEKVIKETRGWDDDRGKTISQRSKEQAEDYRYFPEPDIPSFIDIEKEFKIDLPETIDEKIIKYKNSGVSQQDIDTILNDDQLLLIADEIIGSDIDTKVKIRSLNLAINIVAIRDLSVNFITDLARAIEEEKVGQPAIQPIIKLGLEKHISVDEAIKEGGFEQISDTGELQEIIKKIISQNPGAVADYKKGKENAITFLTGQVMRETRGRANPQEIYKLLREAL